MATNLDQIMVYMTKIGSKTGVRLADNQGSTTKGKNTSTVPDPQFHSYDPEQAAHMHKSVHFGPHSGMAHR